MSEEKASLMVNSNYLLPSTRIRILSLEYTSLPPSLHCSVRALGVQVEEQNTYYDDKKQHGKNGTAATLNYKKIANYSYKQKEKA